MKKAILNILKGAVILLLSMSFFSCSKEEINLNNLDEAFMLRHKNADLPVQIHGNGSEKVFLIILHGGPGGNGFGYRVNSIRTEIEKNNAVVYFDQRGSGNSQGNYSSKDISIDLMAEDVLALVKVIKSKFGDDSKFFLFGHSWGGTLGTATLLKNQNTFSGWIEVCGGHNMRGLFDEYKKVLPQYANEQIALGNSVDYWQNVIDEVEDTDPNFSTENVLRLNRIANTTGSILANDGVINEYQLDLGDNPQVSNGFIDLWNAWNTGRIFDFKKGLNEINFTNRLSEITIPSQLLWGKHDLTVPLALGIEAFDNLGSADKEIVVFEKSGHGPMNTEPELFAEKVIEFINGHK